MTEQIVDLIDGVMPGPRGLVGPRGEQGLPGVNALPADDAVAGYINAVESSTARALRQYRVLLFGDSWTQYHDRRLSTTLQSILGGWVKNYGVNGATLKQINDNQVPAALADTTVINPTHIVIVAGVNGILHSQGTNAETADAMKNLITTIRQAWPDVPIHYFPNMARCPNTGHNELYEAIIHQCTLSGIAVHPESMWLPMMMDFSMYHTGSGYDPIHNIAHLSPSGYSYLAGLIAGTLQGQQVDQRVITTYGISLQRRGTNDFPEPTTGTYINTANANCRINVGAGTVHMRFVASSLSINGQYDTKLTRYLTMRLITPPELDADGNNDYVTARKYNPFPPTGTVYATGCATKSDGMPVYPCYVTVSQAAQGTTAIDIVLDKGDTTTPWNAFAMIRFDLSYPLRFMQE